VLGLVDFSTNSWSLSFAVPTSSRIVLLLWLDSMPPQVGVDQMLYDLGTGALQPRAQHLHALRQGMKG
jgi:hypothetical protein